MIPGAIQDKYILGAVTKVGDPRRKHEDRVFKGEIQRVGGNPFVVGIVADGVGSADAGERGAQLAIDSLVKILKQSQGENISQILEQAIDFANSAVYEDNQRNNADGLTTLVIAVIYKDRCFVGNVGDSRAYWIQSGDKRKMLQLTRDHSYYNIYGGVDSNSEDAGLLVNAIGKKSDVYVDLGFYLKGEKDNVDQALRLGLNGLPIKAGDAIMLCSDGLIKTDRMNVRYATDDEILDALLTEHEPDTAAIKMVSAALGRRPDDNVSAVTIQYLSEEIVKTIESNKKRGDANQRLKRIVPGLIVFTILVFIGMSIWGINRFINPSVQFVALPTYTPYPTLASKNSISVDEIGGIIGQLKSPNGTSQDLANGIYTIYQNSRVEISRDGAGIHLADGTVLLMNSGTNIRFDKIENGFELLLEQGSVLVKLSIGSATLSIKTQDGLVAQVSGSVMGIQNSFDPVGIYVDCYEGHCSISGGSSNIDQMNLDGANRYLFYSAGNVNPSSQDQRCGFWKNSITLEKFQGLGAFCIPEQAQPTATLTPRAPSSGNNNAEATQRCITWLSDHHGKKTCP